MNLDFGILWVEDSFSPEEKTDLERRVRDAGFVARIKSIPNSNGIDHIAHQNNLFHRYDLVLLDYRLREENGDELAPRIRQLFPSTTILFYSGSVEEPELRRLIAERKVEGVYCSARSRFIDRAGSLIDQTARSLNRLSGMRGLAMKVVAECDTLMKSAVLSMDQHEPACASKVSDLDNDVLEFMEQRIESYRSAAQSSLKARLDTRAVDSAKLFGHFRRLIQVAAQNPETFGLTAESVDRLRELRRSTSEYPTKVLQKRNLLGHVVEVEGPQGWELAGDNEISIADFPALRRDFANHVHFIRELVEIVTGLDSQKSQ